MVCPELEFMALRCSAGVTAHLSSQKAKISYRIHRHMCTQETRQKEMSDASGRKELGHTIPAFNIKTSNLPPQPSTTSLAALATESKLARSHSTNRTSMVGAAALISATAAWPLATLRAAIQICAGFRVARERVVAFPMPLFAPVIRMTLEERLGVEDMVAWILRGNRRGQGEEV